MKREMEDEHKSLPRQEGREGLPKDVELLLAEIEKEPVPERLLTLAEELQRVLCERRNKTGS